MCGNGTHANNPRVGYPRKKKGLQRVQGQPGHHNSFQLASATLQNHVSKKKKTKQHKQTNKQKTRTEQNEA